MAIFYGMHLDQEIVTQIVHVGMIGKKMMLNHIGEENKKENT